MANGLVLKNSEGMFKCPKCTNRYNFSKLTREAIRSDKRNLYCPHCGNRVGTLQ